MPMHQSYDYDAESDTVTITKEDKAIGEWLKATFKKAKEDFTKRNARKNALNTVADSLLEDAERVEITRTRKTSKLEDIVNNVTRKPSAATN